MNARVRIVITSSTRSYETLACESVTITTALIVTDPPSTSAQASAAAVRHTGMIRIASHAPCGRVASQLFRDFTLHNDRQ